MISPQKYIIAIPSYKRADTPNKKTLNLLKSSDINIKEKVYIFVADETEYKIYKEILNENDFNSLIIGKPTLKAQRNFILDYFPLDSSIMFLDDDLMEVMTGYKDKETKEIITKNILSLNRVFEVGFEECKRTNSKLFGYYPVYNKFFMSNTISYNLKYIVGACYGIINHKEKQYVYTDDKEDFERSIKCFMNDGKVVRFNYISFKTNYYTEPGGLQETRTLETINKGAEYIVQTYPEFSKIKIKKNGKYEIKLIQPKLVSPPIILTIQRDFNFLNLHHSLLKKLNETTISTLETLRKDNKPSRSTLLLDNPDHTKFKGIKDRPRTMTIGYGRIRTIGYGPFSQNNKHKDLLDLIIQYGKMILPSEFVFTTITINKNLKCKLHKDKGNFGVSALTTLGDYEKGGLFISDKLYSTNNTILMFDGTKLPHQTEDFTGDRFSLIYYKQNLKYIPEEFIYRGTK